MDAAFKNFIFLLIYLKTLTALTATFKRRKTLIAVCFVSFVNTVYRILLHIYAAHFQKLLFRTLQIYFTQASKYYLFNLP